MVKPSFIPPADIRQLRDLVRYRFKLTCMITGEKNRAQNCLTVSNFKLDDVFSDVFGKSSRSITEQILQHPGETFNVAPFAMVLNPIEIEKTSKVVTGDSKMDNLKPARLEVYNAKLADFLGEIKGNDRSADNPYRPQ